VLFARSLYNFDVSALVGLYVSIDAAQFERHVVYIEGGSYAARLHRCTRPSTWTEFGTWNKYDGVSAWTVAGGDVDATTPTPVDYTEPQTGLSIATGLAAFVTDAIALRSNIVSIRGKALSEADDDVSRYTEFNGRGDEPSLRPLLRVTYTAPVAAPPAAGREAGEPFDRLRTARELPGVRPARGARGARGVGGARPEPGRRVVPVGLS
jgi:hypothetical protein